jgi:hypothetical protein
VERRSNKRGRNRGRIRKMIDHTNKRPTHQQKSAKGVFSAGTSHIYLSNAVAAVCHIYFKLQELCNLPISCIYDFLAILRIKKKIPPPPQINIRWLVFEDEIIL